jgi:hypothetical protein
VLPIVFGYLLLSGIVLVGRACWWIDGFVERYIALAARFVVDCVDGDSKVF